ncbi:hypothetical protein C0991_003693, partial [Blastosporella zonata]
AFLAAKEKEVTQVDKALGYHLCIYREERTHFYETHRRRFIKLGNDPHFSGSITPGIPIDKSRLISNAMDIDTEPASEVLKEGSNHDNDEEDDEEGEGKDEEGGAGLLAEALEVFTIAAH